MVIAPAPVAQRRTGLLLSGGLDSGILLLHLLGLGYEVRPFYVRSRLCWEEAEVAMLRKLLAFASQPALRDLVTLDMPADDLYGPHWSVTGQGVPDAGSADEAVYLPGRNALLLLKPALWCLRQGLPQLALAPLRANPFLDARAEFFAALELMLAQATGQQLRIWRPFGELEKSQVMQLGRGYPLELTFSCIDPIEGLHCGRCNKCNERRWAFRNANMPDPTHYWRERAEGATNR
jgi:7-cyano-7-deazaguanine synthase